MSTSPQLFKYPIQVARLIGGRPAGYSAPGPGANSEHPTCPLGTSVAQFLHLMLHTRLGELRSARNFGCAIWDIEFDNEVYLTQWEVMLSRSLQAAIEEHDTRLCEVRVRVDFDPPDSISILPQYAVRHQANITITGVLHLTGEAFRYATCLRLGRLTT